MDAHRSTKRRKLNGTSEEPLSKSEVSGEYDHVSTPARSNTKGQEAGNPKAQSGARDAWKEAKAQAQAMRRLKTAPKPRQQRDVYDDIAGAHAQSLPFKQKPRVASTPVKKTLDPLRNQKSSWAAFSSPSKGTAALGFFKQFHEPKPQPVTSPAPDEQRGDDDATAVTGWKKPGNGESGGRTSHRPANDNDSSAGTSTSATKPGWKGWTYADKPKKTFEDEIKELAEAAREEATRDEDDADARLSQKRSSRVRTIPSVSGAGVQSTPSAAAATVDSPSRRKTATNGEKKRFSAARTSAKHALETSEQTPTNNLDVTDGEDTMDLSTGVLPKPDVELSTPGKTAVHRTVSYDKITFSSDVLGSIRGIVLDRLTSKRPIPLSGLDAEHGKIANLITQTITAGESNSMLVIGSRGSGKSALVDQILREEAVKHPDDFLVVRLNGFIHTDDKLALREIWRQLGRGMEIDDQDDGPKSYADTLTTLLAVLSHPAEQGREQDPDQITKSVIFIIDEFELFANHPRQTLLYNLFDIAQARKAPIAVLGLTTRIDVAESLEKRVKSRFSHRYVHLGMPRSLPAFQDACKAAMTIKHEDLTEEERRHLGSHGPVNERLNDAKGNNKSPHSDWNTFVDALLAEESIDAYVRRLYHTTKSVPNFHTLLCLPISTMQSHTTVNAADLLDHFATNMSASFMVAPDSKLSLLSALSTLQLAMLICAARLTAIHNVDTVPFVQAYEEYKLLASKSKLQASASGALAQGAGSRVWGKAVAEDAWEGLVDYGLLMDDGSRGCRVDVALEEIGMSGIDLGGWGRWCKQI